MSIRNKDVTSTNNSAVPDIIVVAQGIFSQAWSVWPMNGYPFKYKLA